jgi:hypothetical protein
MGAWNETIFSGTRRRVSDDVQSHLSAFPAGEEARARGTAPSLTLRSDLATAIGALFGTSRSP